MSNFLGFYLFGLHFVLATIFLDISPLLGVFDGVWLFAFYLPSFSGCWSCLTKQTRLYCCLRDLR